ncbi:MAG: sarcosine oxidase subunit gamma family protein, partial [Acidimicrobiales bacterium]
MVEPASPIVKVYPPTVSDLTLTDVSTTTKTLVRAAAGDAAASVLGVRFGRARAAGRALVAGTAPSEWVVLGPADEVAAVVDDIDDAGHVSKIDITHGRALFRITGMAATEVLEKICSLDWSDAMTPDGAVVSASMAKVGCDIIRRDVDA